MSKKGSFSHCDKAHKIGGLSVKCIKVFNVSSNLLYKCENEGSLSDKDVLGSFGDREIVKKGSHWVKVGKNGGLSVKASKKRGSFWWHMARYPKLSAPPLGKSLSFMSESLS